MGWLALAALASGCAGPRPSAPAESAVVGPPGWRVALGPTSPIRADWWAGFGDPALTALVTRALATNDDIAIAAGRVEEARAAARLARAERAPEVGGSIAPAESRTLDPFAVPYNAFGAEPGVSASYDLDLFGRLRQASRAARAQLLASEGARDAVRLAIASEVANGYISLCGLDARLEVTKATLAARGEALRVARRRADTGYTSTLELHQAEGEYRAAQQLVPQIELAISRQENALSLLLGAPPGPIARGRPLAALALPAIPDGLPADLLRRRPDLYQAEQTLVAADRSLDSARAAFLPDVSLTGSAGLVLNTALTNSPFLFSLGASILAPIFTGGRLEAQAQGAAARRDQAAFAYRRAALTAFREVDDALSGVQRAAEQTTALAAQRDALAAALRNASARYRAGYSSYLDQLDAQRGLLSAELGLVQARTDQLHAHVALYRAMGGGWTPAEVAAVKR